MFSALVSFMHLYILLVTNNRSDRHIIKYHNTTPTPALLTESWIMDASYAVSGVRDECAEDGRHELLYMYLQLCASNAGLLFIIQIII